jgi:pimeloyl-ACP methyl ester carboxylesterase
MPTLVIVHGAWGGGWEWTPVARMLREHGHDVFTPTLTGTGERAHLARADVSLSTHVQDLVALLEMERLHEVVLCAHSSAAFAATAAADVTPARVALLVYVDGLVPQDGQCLLDALPDWFAEEVRGRTSVAMPARLRPPQGWVPDADLAAYVRRLRDQPAATFTERVRLTGAAERLPRAYVRCTQSTLQRDTGTDPVAPHAERARAEHWLYRDLPAPHDPQLLDPVGTASVLHELASVAAGDPTFSAAEAPVQLPPKPRPQAQAPGAPHTVQRSRRK